MVFILWLFRLGLMQTKPLQGGLQPAKDEVYCRFFPIKIAFALLCNLTYGETWARRGRRVEF